MKISSLLLLLSIFAFTHSQTFNLVSHQILAQNTGPRCLDGSPAAMYIDIGQQTDKFMIFFQGGGLCRGDGLDQMLSYCLNRSITQQGSSKGYPEKAQFNQYVFLNPDSTKNSLLHKWTRIYIPYCDGSLHLGFKSNPVQYKGKKLYFRGQNNTKAHFDYLQRNFNLFNASKIIVSGTSAGAMATYIWGNYVYNLAQNKQQVYLVPDCGIFLIDFVNPWTNKTIKDYTSSLFQLVFTQTKLPSAQCSNKYSDLLECFKAGNLHSILLPKTFVIQSTYDAWGLQQILGLQCLSYPIPSSIQKCDDTERAYIQKYHNQLQLSIANYTKQQRHGVWAIGCVQHGFLDNKQSYQNQTYISPYKSGSTLQAAIQKFLNGQRVIQIDKSTWPQNKGCCGFTQLHSLRKRQNKLHQIGINSTSHKQKKIKYLKQLI